MSSSILINLTNPFRNQDLLGGIFHSLQNFHKSALIFGIYPQHKRKKPFFKNALRSYLVELQAQILV